MNRMSRNWLTLSVLLVVALSLPAQQVRPQVQVEVSEGFPQWVPYTSLLFRDGSNNTEYICKAPAVQASFSWTRAATTLTNIVVATNVGTATTSTAHGLAVGNLVQVSGATVDTDLNGFYPIVSVGSTTTFTITTASVADATYTETPLRLSTTAARTTATIWAIQKLYYTTTYVDRVSYAVGNGLLPGTYNFACGSRTTYAYQ